MSFYTQRKRQMFSWMSVNTENTIYRQFLYMSKVRENISPFMYKWP